MTQNILAHCLRQENTSCDIKSVLSVAVNEKTPKSLNAESALTTAQFILIIYCLEFVLKYVNDKAYLYDNTNP